MSAFRNLFLERDFRREWEVGEGRRNMIFMKYIEYQQTTPPRKIKKYHKIS